MTSRFPRLDRTVFVQQQHVPSCEVNGMSSAQSRHWSHVRRPMVERVICSLQPPPTTMTRGADAVDMMRMMQGSKQMEQLRGRRRVFQVDSMKMCSIEQRLLEAEVHLNTCRGEGGARPRPGLSYEILSILIGSFLHPVGLCPMLGEHNSTTIEARVTS